MCARYHSHQSGVPKSP
ncbi:hypothetical protein LINPERPRIM_LOCUS20842 [Linum perenne]